MTEQSAKGRIRDIEIIKRHLAFLAMTSKDPAERAVARALWLKLREALK